jgi:Domain of unknown function (DUF4224)
MGIFLTDEELFVLTGRRRAKAQAEFLRSRQIRHIMNRAGRVVVVREWLTGEAKGAPIEPNFAALKVLR